MLKKFSESFLLRGIWCDALGTWKPSAILEAMQETAVAHSTLCGLPREVLDSMGVAWVLSRIRVEMERLPRISENICIETYPTPVKHMFFPRSHIFTDAAGKKIGCANSLWVLIDLENRRIVKNDEIARMLPDNSDLEMAAPMPATVRTPKDGAVAGVITPGFTELDMNMHVNNTKYMDWCCNALGIETLCNECIMSFDVNYDAEIRPGTQITTTLAREGTRFTFIGEGEGRRHFGISGNLMPRVSP